MLPLKGVVQNRTLILRHFRNPVPLFRMAFWKGTEGYGNLRKATERYGNHAPLPGIHTKLLPLRGFVDLFDSLGFETYLDLMRLVET